METKLQDFRQQLLDANLWEEELTLKRHEMLKTAGTINTDVYFVLEGSIRAYVNDGDDEHVIRFGYRNDLITALDCFISMKPSELCLQAIKKTRVLVLKRESFRAFMMANEDRMKFWLMSLEQLVFDQLEREKDLLTSSPKERYLRVLKRSPQLFQEIPSKHIASYLRMTPETLSRLKKS